MWDGRGLRTHPCGELVLAVMAWDEMPWTLTDCGLFVKKVRSQLQGDGFSPNSSSLLIEVCGVIGLKAELKSRKSSMTYCRNTCCPRRWGQSGWQLTLRQTQTDSSWKHTDGGPRWCWWRPLCGKKPAIQSTAWLLGWGPPFDSHLCFSRLSRGKC